MKHSSIVLSTVLPLAALPAISANAAETPTTKALVGHVCAISPTGMAMVVNDRAGFVLEPQYSDRPQDDAQVAPGTTAPDGSYLKTKFTHQGANVTLTWGKVGAQSFVATLNSDKPVELGLRTKRAWADFPSSWWSAPGGLDGYLVNGAEGYLSASVRTDPAPTRYEGNYAGEVTMFVQLGPERPLRLTAGLGELPGFDDIVGALAKAEERYENRRISATGDWGGFVEAIADNMNFSRTYSSFDHRSAHIVGRGWWIYKNNNNNPDFGPYFCWDQFFNGNLAVLEDPQGARETIRGVLAYQLPDGFIANCGRWDYPDDGVRNFCSVDRSQPPVGSLSVWNMHERWPDKAFLAEVYPKLVRWHYWWHKNRDGNQNGLLEWGSAKGKFDMARLETGMDDTPHYDGTTMSGTQMSCDSVDLNALWSMDAFYLSKIATALGKTKEARQFSAAHEKINLLINERLWNEEMGLYCSRLWQDQPNGQPAFLTRITPVNFYPLGCGAPDKSRADRALQFLYRPDKFWGEWMLPTVAYDDPEWGKQHYWKGQIWAPTNWLVWQGVKRYADPAHRAEFARRGIRLFMRNWNESRQCCENYRSNTGTCGDNPHYTWGALLNLIGVEALCGVDGNFNPLPYQDSGITENLTLRNIPFGGTLYRIEARNGKVTATKESPVPPIPAAALELHHSKAELRGPVGRDHAIDSISGWENEKTTVVWSIHVNRPGKVEVECLQAAHASSGGNGYDVLIGNKKVSGKVVDTGGWDRFQTVKLGELTIPAAGEYEIAVVPHPKNTVAVMNLRGLRLSGTNFSAKVVTSPSLRRGMYFSKTKYVPEPLPVFAQVKDQLPEPVLPSRPVWTAMYWKCWELAFSHLKSPQPGSPFVSNWIDEAFCPNIFQWDTCFMMMFGRYGHAQFPFIQSLDNFYARQRQSGYICREIRETDGAELKFGHNGKYDDPTGWNNSINPPLFAWAECESFKVTGDKSRFAAVLPVLEKYVAYLNRDGDPDADPKTWESQGRRSVGTPHQLYWNTPLGSGMDDIPKPANKGAGWVDMSCQMVMQYKELAMMCRELGMKGKAEGYEKEAKVIADRINQWCWNEQDGFYYDVLADGSQFKKKTLCGFWPMIAGIASPDQVKRLAAHLKDEKSFWRPFVFPALAANEPEYNFPSGGYWKGAVWAPTNYQVIKGLEACGEEPFAAEATEKYLKGMADVFTRRGTVFENYMPEKFEPQSGTGDFVGWTGVGPITLLIENVLGFRPDGVRNTLAWNLRLTEQHGIKRLHFGDVTASLVCAPRATPDAPAEITVESDRPFTLTLRRNGATKAFQIPEGGTRLKF